VAYLAHIGGFVAGFLLVRLFGAQPTRPGGPGGNAAPYRFAPRGGGAGPFR
jgi:hypothetical protein